MPRPEDKPLFEGSEIIIESSGNLHSSYEYVDYQIGDNRVTMDGVFDAQELRAIADYMEKHQ